MTDTVLYELDGHVATITYNRPDALNAINGEMRADLNAAFARFRDEEDAWIGIVTGAGRAFCAGADVRDGAGSTGTFAGTFWEKPTINSFESGWEIFKPVIAAVNGDDFTPFNEAIWIKQAHLGGSVAWHQDGFTHWDSPDLDAGTHGFNFMAQLYGSTAANGLWVLPGSHRTGKADIRALVAAAGSERLPDAVPLVCRAGDVAITNRQVVHGSFANTSRDWRVTVNFGFHRRRSVLGVAGGGVHNAPATYDSTRIAKRARVIGWAIDARRHRFPDETPFVYAPQAAAGEVWPWDDAARAAIKDYNLLDLGI